MFAQIMGNRGTEMSFGNPHNEAQPEEPEDDGESIEEDLEPDRSEVEETTELFSSNNDERPDIEVSTGTFGYREETNQKPKRGVQSA